MIPVQPVFSLHYFKFRENKPTAKIKRLFYLSWEDAFWDVLLKKNVDKDAYILLPNFFCRDVEDNIKLHGYKIANYKIKNNLEANKNDFVAKIKKFQPKVVVVFHPVGIESNLFNDPLWLKKATGESILIEDSVHRIINPSKVKIIKDNHFVIDSLRKVVPLQGASLYGKKKDVNFSAPLFYQSFLYKIKVNALWFLMETFLLIGKYKTGEKLMLMGYELIGDALTPASGLPIFNFLAKRVDIHKLERIKKRQARYYESKLGNAVFVKIPMTDFDRGNLRGYPLVLPNKKGKRLLNSIRERNIFLRFELSDSEWSSKQKIIYLPLGIHVDKSLQDQICELSYNTLNAKA